MKKPIWLVNLLIVVPGISNAELGRAEVKPGTL